MGSHIVTISPPPSGAHWSEWDLGLINATWYKNDSHGAINTHSTFVFHKESLTNGVGHSSHLQVPLINPMVRTSAHSATTKLFPGCLGLFQMTRVLGPQGHHLVWDP